MSGHLSVCIISRSGCAVSGEAECWVPCSGCGALINMTAHVTRGDLSLKRGSTRSFVITEKAPTRAFSWLNRAFSWLKAATTTFTFKTLLRHYAKRVLTPWSLNVKLGPQRNYHNGRAAIRHYANQTARAL